jgi:hypothetical protein
MAVTAQTPLIDYVASGSTADFVFPFLVTEGSHLKVFVNGVLTVSGYSLAGIGNPTGGTLTFTSIPVFGTRVVLARQVPLARTTDYIEGGALRAEVLDKDFDSIVRMVQDIRADAITTTEFQSLADQVEADTAAAAASAAAALASQTASSASQTAAAASASAASTSASSASTSASTASTAAASATDSASTASTAATNAATSETNAATSASTATAAASSASTSATNAAASATAAGTSASNAATSETNAAASAASAANRVPRTSTTGSAVMPTGTSAQRDGSPSDGYTRFNTTIKALEVYDASSASWVPAGQGATGAVGNPAFYENDQTITGDYTITANKNAGSFGPMSIASGVTLTIPSGSVWTVVD